VLLFVSYLAMIERAAQGTEGGKGERELGGGEGECDHRRANGTVS
jgi:hypothetical protein